MHGAAALLQGLGQAIRYAVAVKACGLRDSPNSIHRSVERLRGGLNRPGGYRVTALPPILCVVHPIIIVRDIFRTISGS